MLPQHEGVQLLRIIVTGAAGFIGFHFAQRLLTEGHTVIGLDNLNDYYDVRLKEDRLALLRQYPEFHFEWVGLEDGERVKGIFRVAGAERVVHLAAQAGVRYSLQNPLVYIQSNVLGFTNVLEACRELQIPHLIYASSSSVYGANAKIPFSVRDNVDHPVSIYAATKKADELLAHTYSHLFALPTTGLRFFTVYGPWGRPDMAYFSFTKAILEGRPIQVFNHGRMQRDFTYIDDIVEGMVRLLDRIPRPNPELRGSSLDPGTSHAPYRIYNIGNNKPVELLRFIEVLEQALGKQAIKEFLPMQPGDVPVTYADIDDLEREIGFRPATSLEEGIGRFVRWYLDYYR